MPSGVRDAVVVGGGIAGLVVARDLAAAGLHVTLLEAADRLGGCVAAHEVAGLRLDAGAESFATRAPTVSALVTELGLAADLVTPSTGGAWLALPDRAVPLPSTGILGIPGALWSTEMLEAIGILGLLRATADRVLPGSVGLGGPPVTDGDTRTRPGESRWGPAGSLGRLVRVRMGRRVLERLVAPVVTGVHSAHPDQVDLDAVLPGVRHSMTTQGRFGFGVSLTRVASGLRSAAPAGSAVASLAGGMSRLVEALAAELAAQGVVVRTGTRVESVSRAEAGGPAEQVGTAEQVGQAGSGSWAVRHPDGTYVTDTVVVAVPGVAAVALLDDVVPLVRSLGADARTPVVLATLVLDSPALDAAPRGTGVLVSDHRPGVRAKALTHATAKWAWLAEQAGPGRHVLRLSYGRAGGSGSAPPPSESDDDLLATALSDARQLLGVTLGRDQVVGFARTVWDGGLPHARPGHRERVATIRRELAGTQGLWACGAWIAGTGLTAVVADARATARAVVSVRE